MTSAASNLQPRDLEILRTLARLRFVTAREMCAVFFPSPSVASRRLVRLGQRDLIRDHKRTPAPGLTYHAWRLTPAGIEVVGLAFPDEPLPDGLGERLADANLHNPVHREAVSQIYLRLLGRAADPMPHEQDRAAVTTRAAQIRARAFEFWWQPDGDVQLAFRTQDQQELLVPDATLCARRHPVRLFIELDRSTHSLTRIRQVVARYSRFLEKAYRQTFPDGRVPEILYVTRSEGRRQGVERILADGFGKDVRWAAITDDDAPTWIEQHFLRLAARPRDAVALDTPPPLRDGDAPLAHAAHEVYRWAREYRLELRTAGSDLPADGLRSLRRLRDRLGDPGDDHAD